MIKLTKRRLTFLEPFSIFGGIMFSSIKRLTKHSLVYGVGHILARFVGFLLLPLYTNKLPTTEFGVAAVVFSYLAVLTIVYTYGLDAAFLRYYILNDNPEEKRKIFSTAFWAIFTIAILFSVLIYFSSVTISRVILSTNQYAHIFKLTSFILLFDALAVLPFLYLRALEKSVIYTSLKFINVVITVSLNLLFIVKMGKGVEGIFLANAWASGITFFLVSPILLKQIRLEFSKIHYFELLRFGLPYLPSTMAVVLLDLVDRFILEKLAGLDVTGLYNAGYKLGMFMALFVTAFRFAWHPFFLSTSRQENAREIFSRVLTYFTTIGAAIFLVISLFIDQIVRFEIFGFTLFGTDYWASTKVVPVILLAYLTYGIYVNFVVGIHLEKKTQYLPFVTGSGTAVNVLANFILIPKFGMMGAAYATLLGYGVMAILLYILVQRIYAIPYEFPRLLKLAGVVMVLFYLGYYFQWSQVIVFKLLVILSFPVLLLITGFFDKNELEKLKGILRLKTITSN